VSVLAVGLVLATAIDLRSRRIPNQLTAAMAAAGLGFAAGGISGISVAASIGGIVLGLLLMLPGYALGATGAGDVKLMAAVGAIVGPPLVVWAFICTALAGGVIALIVAVRRRRLGATLAGTGRLVAAPRAAHKEIEAATAARRFAYGPAIAIGSLIAVLMK
jgi:prepilin peptidase CpaA